MIGLVGSVRLLRSNCRAGWCDTRAVTAMEYGLIAALVAVVMISALTTVGTQLSATFTSIGAKI